MWGVVTPEEAKAKIEEQRKEITKEPENLEEQAISLVGRDIYEKLIKGYTEKQWGRDCRELPAFIIKRLPVRLTFDNNYFNALYQGIPVGGYTKMVENLLDGIEVRLNTEYLENKEALDALAEKVIYTGPIDAYFGYELGTLEYRSVRFETELLDQENYQGNAAVNYTDRQTPWTRIIEHKWFEFGKDSEGNDIPKTVISREYSSEWKLGDEPYYPVNDEKNGALYARYKKMAEKEEQCPFLNIQGRCSIHAFRPGFCRMFPLGRIYEEDCFHYFLQVHECRQNPKAKVKISKWLGISRIQEYERFVLQWHTFLKKAEKIAAQFQEESAVKNVCMFILKTFYLTPYKAEADFYEQFEERLKKAEIYFF